MSQYRSFTAFRDDGKRICHYSTQACSPEDLMRQVTNFYSDGWAGEVTLIAWAEEVVAERGGQLECDALCAESIAAGRLIEKVDGRWVARGVPVEDKAVAPQATTEPMTLGALLRQALERLENKPAAPIVRPGATFMGTVPEGLTVTPADLRMVSRDGAPKAMRCVCGESAPGVVHRTDGPCYVQEPKSTSHPPIAGLTRTAAIGSHLLGGLRY